VMKVRSMKIEMVGVSVLLAVTLLVAGAVALSAYVPPPATPSQGATKEFTIVAASDGFNDSLHEGIPWPIMVVHKGDKVTMRVVNRDTVEAHGFAIAVYSDRGLTLRPGQEASVSFVADKEGNFTIYCNIFCTVHQFMVAKLVVEG